MYLALQVKLAAISTDRGTKDSKTTPRLVVKSRINQPEKVCSWYIDFVLWILQNNNVIMVPECCKCLALLKFKAPDKLRNSVSHTLISHQTLYCVIILWYCILIINMMTRQNVVFGKIFKIDLWISQLSKLIWNLQYLLLTLFPTTPLTAKRWLSSYIIVSIQMSDLLYIDPSWIRRQFKSCLIKKKNKSLF